MIEEILCDARRQKRSIVELCEHFGDRRARAKFTNQNDFLPFRADTYKDLKVNARHWMR